MSTLEAYLLGLATIPGLVLAAFLLLVVYAFVARFMRRRGWFTEFGPVPETRLSVTGLVTTRCRLGVVTAGVWCARESLDRPGSRWVQVGPVCVGRKDARLTLTEDEYWRLRDAEKANAKETT